MRERATPLGARTRRVARPAGTPRWSPRLTRRGLLSASARAGIGAVGLALIGCAGDDDDDDAAEAAVGSEPPDSTRAQTTGETAAVTNPLRRVTVPDAPQPGGDLRLHASLLDLDFFDSHRAQFPLTQLLAALQQSKLVRYSDVDRGVLEADLAALPEIPDALTYVFELRPGVRWGSDEPTNGRPFSADDLRANLDRQIAGLDAAGALDPSLERQSLFQRTTSVEVFDDTTVIFRSDGPDATYLGSVLAGPWSFIQAPETWERYGDSLRDEPLQAAYYSGTGPFRIGSFRPSQGIDLVPNPTYFRPGRPYLDRIALLDLPTSAGQEQAFRDGDLDLWLPGDAVELSEVEQDVDDVVVETRPLPFGVECWFSYRETLDNPLADRRVAQALHLALDRDALIDATYGSNGLVSGPAPWYTPGWATPPSTLAQEPGFRPRRDEDLTALRGLLDAAALDDSLTIHLPDVFSATYPAVAATVERTLSANLARAVDVEISQYTRIFEGIGDGSVPIVIGWGTAIKDPDPTDRLWATMRTDAAGNLGGFSDPAVDTWLTTARETLQLGDRQRIFHEAITPALLGQPAWIVPIGHGVQRLVHRSDVVLPSFGFGWDGHRYEEAWRV